MMREEGTPPSPTSPITSRRHQAKKRAVMLKFSPPQTTEKQPENEEIIRLKKVSPSGTYTRRTPPEVTKDAARQSSRMKDAKTSYDKANECLSNSRNLKTEIKQGVQGAMDRLYALIKEMDRDMREGRMKSAGNKVEMGEREIQRREMETQTEGQGPEQEDREKVKQSEKDFEREKADLIQKMGEHASLIRENLERMNNLSQVIQKNSVDMSEVGAPKPSYASVAAVRPGAKPPTYRTLHSVAVTSGKGHRSAEETLKEVQQALDAKQGGLEVERVRKARDGRIIISCRTEEDREKVKHKLTEKRTDLTAENITNKKPLVMITGVLRVHTDEDLFQALRNQNRAVFEGLGEAEDQMEAAYKIRGKNPNTHRVVLRVTPTLWRRLTEVGTVKVDLQTLQVADRSPLTQCTICLGFGHGRRLCTETQVLCGHCGGPHTISECEEHSVGAQPSCKNCTRERRPEATHNAFSEKCPVRARWDKIVRATVAYS
ncbi:hypothetical protein K1T71_014901 [Dendrolimus kikuchii]|nr:hypothetical protein K1T71_014901 [Dendrolimus kikuchii]